MSVTTFKKVGQMIVTLIDDIPVTVSWDAVGVAQRNYIVSWGLNKINNWIRMNGYPVLPLTHWNWVIDHYVGMFTKDILQIVPVRKRVLLRFDNALFVVECTEDQFERVKKLHGKLYDPLIVSLHDSMKIDDLLLDIKFDAVVQLNSTNSYRESGT